MDTSWSAAIFGTICLAAFAFMMWKGPRYLDLYLRRLERKYYVRIITKFRSYQVVGDVSLFTKAWINFLIFASHFIIYFAPFLLVALLGWAFNVFQ